MHHILLFNALHLIVICLICPCKSNGYFGTPPILGNQTRASLSNRAIFTVVGGVTSLTFFQANYDILEEVCGVATNPTVFAASPTHCFGDVRHSPPHSLYQLLR